MTELVTRVMDAMCALYAGDARRIQHFTKVHAYAARIALGEGLCEAESVKAVSEIYSPVNGSVRRVNRALEDAPESVNDAPYDAWMVELENVTGAEDLMDAAAYREFLKSEGHEYWAGICPARSGNAGTCWRRWGFQARTSCLPRCRRACA